MKKQWGLLSCTGLICLLFLVSFVAGTTGVPVYSSPVITSSVGSSDRLSNLSVTPREIHSGDTVIISFDHSTSLSDPGNLTQSFSTELDNATWDTTLSMNGGEPQHYAFTGRECQSPPSAIAVSSGDEILMHIVLAGTAPHVTEDTTLSLVVTRTQFEGEHTGFISAASIGIAVMP